MAAILVVLVGCDYNPINIRERKLSEIKKVDKALSECSDHACFEERLSALAILSNKLDDRPNNSHDELSFVNPISFSHQPSLLRLSKGAEEALFKMMQDIASEQENKYRKYGGHITSHVMCNQGQPALYHKIDIGSLKPFSPRISTLAETLLENCVKQEEEEIAMEKQRILDEQKAKAEEAKAQKQREYNDRYFEIIWRDEETKELTGKAIGEKKRVRKYRSLSNNDMAQAFLKVYNEYGQLVKNPETWNEYYEVRVDCDTYSVIPTHIGDSNFRYYMGGEYSPKEICSIAGYPRR
jgi:hypothetical protein